MDNLSFLRFNLNNLAQVHNQNFSKEKFDVQLSDVLEANGFFEHESVPTWLVQFFEAILNKNIINKTVYRYSPNRIGDVYNLLADLEDMIQLRWQDEGERVELVSDKLNVYGIISSEDNTFQVGKF
jgi:hypothetical protein